MTGTGEQVAQIHNSFIVIITMAAAEKMIKI
jgi:hypothetical protein